MDRGGNPTINPFINPDGEKNLFNSRQPADDVANYLGPWSVILENAGGYTPEAAKAAALEVLPDILHYDRTKAATYPNGRILTDDVYSLRFAWLTKGKVPPPASSRTTTCSPSSPTLARPTLARARSTSSTAVAGSLARHGSASEPVRALVRPEVAVPDQSAVTRARRRVLEHPSGVACPTALDGVARDMCLAFG